MIELYYWPTPIGHKITIFCEEAGIPYTIKPVNIQAGEQFQPDFLKISPNNRMPAIVDTERRSNGSNGRLAGWSRWRGRFTPQRNTGLLDLRQRRLACSASSGG